SMTYMVRQLDPTPNGLPLELYFYISDTRFKSFETLAADIFDHVYAVIKTFGLEIFQTPAGTDIRKIKN
ncbi:MAG: mechanosensitive ion channel family protein, partial [Muribaculaceae bacterium]|nr:mechanosensitive ion channel family protein [Muribaculaceae bacterium]